MKRFLECLVCIVIVLALLMSLYACKDKNEGIPAKYTATEGLLVYYIFYASYSFTEAELEEHNFKMDDTSLKDQMYDENRSWYDVIVERAVDALTRVLVYANAAVDDGVKLDADDNAAIENKLFNQRFQAAAQGYDLDSYLAYIYNNNYVTEAVLKTQLELSTLADKYSAILEDRFRESITDAMVNKKLSEMSGERDTSVTRNIANIILSYNAYSDEEEAEAAAKELIEKIRAEEKLTAELFEEYAKEHSHSKEVFFYNVAKGDMISAMDNWIYGDASRKAGDVGLVASDYGYHIMYYVSDGDPVYIANAKIAIIDDMFYNWFEENKAKYNIGLTDELINGIELDV